VDFRQEAESMGRANLQRIGAELVPIALVIAGLVATALLIRRAFESMEDQAAAPAVVAQIELDEPVKPPPPSPPPPAEPAPPRQPEVDHSLEEIKRLDATAECHTAEAGRLEQLAEARRSSVERLSSEVARWRRRESLVRSRAADLDRVAARLESTAEELKLERDLLAWQRDQARRSLADARSRAEDSYAVVPYKGESGTWRRPIVIDCQNGTVRLLPDGPSFGMLEIGGGFGSRSNALAAAVRRRASRIEQIPAADGAPSIPYILFLVRPDGIRPYYEARGVLEPLGIAFGYELVGQDWHVEAPPDSEPSPARVDLAAQTADDPARVAFPAAPQPRWPGRSGLSDDAMPRPPVPEGRAQAESTPREPRIGYLPDPRRAGAPVEDPELEGSIEIIPGRSGGMPRSEAPARGRNGYHASPPDQGTHSGRRPLEGEDMPEVRGSTGSVPLASSMPRGVDWIDLSLECGPGGLTIQPGGYRLSLQALESGELLLGRLQTLARRWQTGQDGTVRMPRLRFLVRPGGEQAFWLARRHTTFAGLDWPATLQMTEAAAPRVFRNDGEIRQ
jgi:hypothetical protein